MAGNLDLSRLGHIAIGGQVFEQRGSGNFVQGWRVCLSTLRKVIHRLGDRLFRHTSYVRGRIFTLEVSNVGAGASTTEHPGECFNHVLAIGSMHSISLAEGGLQQVLEHAQLGGVAKLSKLLGGSCKLGHVRLAETRLDMLHAFIFDSAI